MTTIINQHLRHYIGWPTVPREIEQARQDFQARTDPGIPYICGIVDGSHVNIVTPSENEPQFVNRHQQHSINCMAVCGPNMDFYFFSSRWPGSVNDSRVLRNSTLFTRFQGRWRPFPNARIVGNFLTCSIHSYRRFCLSDFKLAHSNCSGSCGATSRILSVSIMLESNHF